MKEILFDGVIAENTRRRLHCDVRPSVIGPTVDFLTDLAGDGEALELAVGTGRIGLPLSQRGVPVHGIDESVDMIAQLQAKPGSEAISVSIGDFSTTEVGRTFRLAYLVYNTIGNLTSQEEQLQCFHNVAVHLEAGGCFVIEVGTPQLQRLVPGQTTQVFSFSSTRLGFDELDVATQQGVSHHYWLADGQRTVFRCPYRYVWPSELDLMARLAGLRLRERWADWDRSPFTSNSGKHVSVWGEAGMKRRILTGVTITIVKSGRAVGAGCCRPRATDHPAVGQGDRHHHVDQPTGQPFSLVRQNSRDQHGA